MKNQSFKSDIKSLFELCQKALTDFECEITNTEPTTWTIEAKKGGGLFSYGHSISVILALNENGSVDVSITSDSIGIQLIDWGTNSEIEDELIKLITDLKNEAFRL